MGVPKFFRFINERYPCLKELVEEFRVPEFDNLYLDMNGIIHFCSHPDSFDPNFRISEEKIFSSIFHYIEVLFNIIKPRKLLFLAVDGVAPRAKMNQQRARRYRTAKEAEVNNKEALNNSQNVSTDRFDSNCVTPGTVFMDRLHSQLKYFITSKISNDPLWQSCKVILSGHQTPGEGEHKIMDYIRYMKTLPDYDGNTRHCLYGLDADLIMLGMSTHEPHFCLLREEVFFRKSSKKIISPDEKKFYLLHLSLLREYLDLEFQELKEKLPFQYNLKNIIDDWILMGFLVGNDFIPNLPDLHINKGAFSLLYQAYKDVLPTLDGYLNENGYLNLSRFQNYMEKIAEHDLEAFEDTYANLVFWEQKTGKSFTTDKANGESERKSELEELIKAVKCFEMAGEESVDEEMDEYDENELFLGEFKQHKQNYYMNKLDFTKVTPEVLKSQAEGYIRAIQWNLHYYYQGCQSWSWYYPHHYAPYISDIKDFKDLKIDFEMGKPFLPFEQLLAVLPPASKQLLPEVYHNLMTSPNSPVKDFYPEDFETDLNGKQQDWEAVVLIPFIDEKRLLEAMKDCDDKLTPEERRRNQHGPMHVYTYTSDNLGVYHSKDYFPSIPENHALMKDIFTEEIAVEKSNLKYGLSSNALSDIVYLGFPTLKHIPYTARLKVAKVKVFESPSKGENMILTLTVQKSPAVEVLAKSILGKNIYTNWPHLVESRAIAVSNGETKYYLTETGDIDCMVLDKQNQFKWIGESDTLAKYYLEKLGVEIGPVNVIVYVLTLEGRKYTFDPTGKIRYEKSWSDTPNPCAFQVIVQDVKFHNSHDVPYADFKNAFPLNSVVFMLGQPHYGSMGRILDSTECYAKGRLKVELETVEDPIVNKSLLKVQPNISYFSCRAAALKVGISPRLFSRITGSILVSMTNEPGFSNSGSKINIGLSLKFFKKNEEIPGYTKMENDVWLYSKKAVDVIDAYVKNFSRVMEYLSSNLNTNVFFVQDIFPGPEGASEMKEMVAWIKAQEYNYLEHSKCGTTSLDPLVVAKLEEIVDRSPKRRSIRHVQIKPHLLYKSDLTFGNVPPVNSATHCLLDRVVSIRSSYTVPTGLRGYIISIRPASSEANYTYDILFDRPFVGALKLNSTSERAFRMSRASFLNITDANRQNFKSSFNSVGSAQNNNNYPRTSYIEPKTSAFVQWSHQPFQSPMQPSNEEFKKMWLNLQTVKPQEEALKKILKIDKAETPKIEEHVKTFFEKVTKVSNGGPRTPEKLAATSVEEKNVKNKFYLQLFSYFQKRTVGQPRFKYIYVGKKVMAQVILSDGTVYSGFPCEDKESACENASLQALAALGEIPLNNELLQKKKEKEKELEIEMEKEKEKEKEKQKKIIENQMRLCKALTKPKEGHQGKPSQSNYKTPLLIPNPPSQWVGLSKNSQPQGFSFYPPRENSHVRSTIPEKAQNSNNSLGKKPKASALEFVPLQAITGKRSFAKIATIPSSKQPTQTPKKPEVVATVVNNSVASPATIKVKRQPKIAAKLNLDPNLY